jgi:hypothetical protein
VRVQARVPLEFILVLFLIAGLRSDRGAIYYSSCHHILSS